MINSSRVGGLEKGRLAMEHEVRTRMAEWTSRATETVRRH